MAPMHKNQPIYIICESNKLPGFYLIRIFFVSGLLHWYGNWRSITKALLARSSLTEVFCKKCVLENFAKFTGKHLHLRLFFNKVSLVQVFSCEFCEISKSTVFLQNTSGDCFWIDHFRIKNAIVFFLISESFVIPCFFEFYLIIK